MDEELFDDDRYRHSRPAYRHSHGRPRQHPAGRRMVWASLFDYTDPLRPDERPLAGWSDEDLQKVIESWR